jgi:hypothetical protein
VHLKIYQPLHAEASSSQPMKSASRKNKGSKSTPTPTKEAAKTTLGNNHAKNDGLGVDSCADMSLLSCILYWSLTPELTGAGGPIGPQGTNIGHENGEAMANVGVRVERFVRLGRVGRVCQVHSNCVRFECPKKRSNGLRAHTFRWTCSQCKSYEFSWRSS